MMFLTFDEDWLNIGLKPTLESKIKSNSMNESRILVTRGNFGDF